jgi:hypothetical protein
MSEKIDAAPIVETCDVADGKGQKVEAHRCKALRLDTGELEMTVFIGGDSGNRAADYARQRYAQPLNVVMHCDPYRAQALGRSQNMGVDDGRSN